MVILTAMVASNHALSGAIIGAVLPLPIAIPLAFMSHFLLDALPHYGIDRKERVTSLTYRLVIGCDLAVGISGGILLAVLHKWNMLICGTIAYSPDLTWVWYYFRQGRTLDLKTQDKFMAFHRKIQ